MSPDSGTSARPFVVLVGVGEEEIPDAALQYAAGVVAAGGGIIRLVHAVPTRFGTAAQEHPLLDFSAIELVGEQLVAAAAERLEFLQLPGVTVETSTCTGSAERELRRESSSVDLVVLQHRILSRLRRLVTGSVAVGVARSCAVPVVSVPEFWAPWPGQSPRVVVGLDGVTGQSHLLRHAFGRAARDGASLEVLHAWHVPVSYDVGIASSISIPPWEEGLTQQLDAEVAAVADAFPGVAVTTRVVRQRPADALFESSRTGNLIVLGRHRHNHLGWVARTVLRESLCPVEIVPEPTGDGQAT
jgi:nucleotide-binding universal stress UspA family protein